MTPSPTRTTSMVSPLNLRTDMPREQVTTYWATAHGDKVKKIPNLIEYNQRLFSATDHGFWPATATVGTIIPTDWRVDGCSEVRFGSTVGILNSAAHAREVNLDEQNAFTRVLGQATAPGGGRWWTTGFDDTFTTHVALLLRRRQGVRATAFRMFVNDKLSAALLSADAHDLRTYPFLPYTRLANNTPGVNHDYPVEHRYHGAALFGVTSRAAIDDMLDSPAIKAIVATQHEVLTAVHAYVVERSLPIIRMGQRP
jgi:hypothetical protein